MQGLVFSISEGSLHDGPGLRTAVFLKGCPLRCRWCHAPEGQSPQTETLNLPDGKRVCGVLWDSRELAAYLLENCRLCPEGGITFSGGEPLMQPEFLFDTLRRLSGVHTIIETSGMCPETIFHTAAGLCSRIHFGLKIVDSQDAVFWTGTGTEQILKNLISLDCMKNRAEYLFRIPLIAGAVDTEKNMQNLVDLCRKLKRLSAIEFLPANTLAPAKYQACGKSFEPLCADCRTGTVPSWFEPGVPWKILK